MFCEMLFFLIYKFIPGNFLYCLRDFLMLLVLLLKWNKTCCIEFFLVKIFVISIDEYSLFLSHLKYFFNDDSKWIEKTMLVLLSRIVINKLFCLTTNIQLCMFGFYKGVKLVYYWSHKWISFIHSKL